MAKKKRSFGFIKLIVLLALIAVFGIQWIQQGTTPAGNRHQDTLPLEMAHTREGQSTQLIQHTGYTTNFNTQWQIPNWVAYDLTQEEVKGSVPRPSRYFEQDPLATGMRVMHQDYSRSGYTRGHMAPAADMRWSEQVMNESFFLSNICPQKAELNDGVWKHLEERVRALSRISTVYICCGPIVGDTPMRIGTHKVAVPDRFFKVLCMQRHNQWQAIGFIFPNDACSGSMFDYAMSVNEVERITGHDFFYNLPDDIEETIEAAWKMQDWQ